MRKITQPLLYFIIGILSIMGLFMAINNLTPSLDNGQELPIDITEKQYSIRGIIQNPETQRYTVSFTLEEAVDLTLVLTDMTPFSLYVDDTPYYIYESTDVYQRVQYIDISQDSTFFENGSLSFQLDIPSGFEISKLSIGHPTIISRDSLKE